jgi:hypothetical protein
MTQEELKTYSSGPVAVSAGRGGGGGGEEEEAEAHHCSFQTEVLFVLHSACAHAQVRAGIFACSGPLYPSKALIFSKLSLLVTVSFFLFLFPNHRECF